MHTNRHFDEALAANYRSHAQIARILTEDWVSRHMYCPRCGHSTVSHFENNRPVADFFCPACNSEYELKSAGHPLGRKVTDGAYDTMISRITSNQNPDFFFLTYAPDTLDVQDFLLVPKHFFTPQVIERRNPLAPTARRAGWVGCNILLDQIPTQGKIYIIQQGREINKERILHQVSRSNQLSLPSLQSRGWLLDVLSCVNQLPQDTFSLHDLYAFSDVLATRHPQNQHIQAKIRQQLQFLRDKGFLLFLGDGHYQKISDMQALQIVNSPTNHAKPCEND